MSALVIIPTYQEAANIENVLTQVRQSVPSAHVLVVDDSSPDETAELAGKVGAQLGGIDVLLRPGKEGLGAAYRAGFAWGQSNGYEIMIEMDADLSHDPAALPRLIEAIESGADLVIGSRYVAGGAVPGWPAHRLMLSQGGNAYARLLLGMKVADLTSGYRAFRSSKLAEMDLEAVRADGYGFQIELAYRMARVGGKIKEIPITFVDRTQGKSKMSSRIIFEALLLVTGWAIRDRFRGLRNKARKIKAN